MSNEVTRERARRWFGRSLEKLHPAERRVLERAGRPLVEDYAARAQAKITFGERLSDRIAEVGGSWHFILSFLGFLVLWAVVNVVLLRSDAFDPYPFVFLNLILSMLAAIQAPIIMMSQNRAADRDRIEAGHDYEVNLKAEIEIIALHEKIDSLRRAEIAALTETLDRITTRLERIEARLPAERP
ncbi:DUF1003 domain-containing protein [Acuticoccus sp. M5D2P5]|uniref:DUF1003 domain-containing protein n=1 Tax=Acuticoccus kalidii TaxID=2910977 RepID=UPI001F22C65B|nr:DUF1003 domain-containing protein [Acuticoccus kalidii]MCF3933472.1 DUF1003 domain-containing protein [Acuticoccus kalidii]